MGCVSNPAAVRFCQCRVSLQGVTFAGLTSLPLGIIAGLFVVSRLALACSAGAEAKWASLPGTRFPQIMAVGVTVRNRLHHVDFHRHAFSSVDPTINWAKLGI